MSSDELLIIEPFSFARLSSIARHLHMHSVTPHRAITCMYVAWTAAPLHQKIRAHPLRQPTVSSSKAYRSRADADAHGNLPSLPSGCSVQRNRRFERWLMFNAHLLRFSLLPRGHPDPNQKAARLARSAVSLRIFNPGWRKRRKEKQSNVRRALDLNVGSQGKSLDGHARSDLANRLLTRGHRAQDGSRTGLGSLSRYFA